MHSYWIHWIEWYSSFLRVYSTPEITVIPFASIWIYEDKLDVNLKVSEGWIAFKYCQGYKAITFGEHCIMGNEQCPEKQKLK